ncbi:hypothetical protein AV654_19635 [Paenibacillus elgii]|uniref:Uncharacterized protein n=1 Tax=Paenibacillus elgii TaxID=189691 RepID=A0A161S1W0_9BACL|nr:hypothetical protein [Paenibacillus elgii]KZE78189.1 hypothetical protein AV654_19635 [Paenibacillus elgii]
MKINYLLYFFFLFLMAKIFQKWPIGGSWDIFWIVLSAGIFLMIAEKLKITERKIPPLAFGIIGAAIFCLYVFG